MPRLLRVTLSQTSHISAAADAACREEIVAPIIRALLSQHRFQRGRNSAVDHQWLLLEPQTLVRKLAYKFRPVTKIKIVGPCGAEPVRVNQFPPKRRNKPPHVGVSHPEGQKDEDAVR